MWEVKKLVPSDDPPMTISPPHPPASLVRTINGHEGSALNNAIKILADARDENGGSHVYWITVGKYADADPEDPIIAAVNAIRFQNGPLKEAGHNGISDEALIAIVIDRLEGFQQGPINEPGARGKYNSRYNALAITKLEEALMWLQKRTTDRQRRGVEGTHQV